MTWTTSLTRICENKRFKTSTSLRATAGLPTWRPKQTQRITVPILLKARPRSLRTVRRIKRRSRPPISSDFHKNNYLRLTTNLILLAQLSKRSWSTSICSKRRWCTRLVGHQMWLIWQKNTETWSSSWWRQRAYCRRMCSATSQKLMNSWSNKVKIRFGRCGTWAT